MALVSCPECGKEISDKASSCPNCGFPINSHATDTTNQTAFQTNVSIDKNANEKKESSFPPLVLFIIIALFCGILIIFLNRKCKYEGCFEPKLENKKYCLMHSCIKTGCDRSVSYGDMYCYLHNSTVSSSSSSTQPKENAVLVLKVSNIKIDHNSIYTTCNGVITNNGYNTYTFVQIKASFKDSSGTVLDTDWTYAVGSEGLAPGESSTFVFSVPKNYKITDCSISLIDYDAD